MKGNYHKENEELINDYGIVRKEELDELINKMEGDKIILFSTQLDYRL